MYGVNGYVLKPIDIKQLMRTIQVLIDYWFEAAVFFPMQQELVVIQNHQTIVIIDDCLEDQTHRRYLLADDIYTYRIFEEEDGGKWTAIVQVSKARCDFARLLLPDIDGL